MRHRLGPSGNVIFPGNIIFEHSGCNDNKSDLSVSSGRSPDFSDLSAFSSSLVIVFAGDVAAVFNCHFFLICLDGESHVASTFFINIACLYLDNISSFHLIFYLWDKTCTFFPKKKENLRICKWMSGNRNKHMQRNHSFF